MFPCTWSVENSNLRPTYSLSSLSYSLLARSTVCHSWLMLKMPTDALRVSERKQNAIIGQWGAFLSCQHLSSLNVRLRKNFSVVCIALHMWNLDMLICWLTTWTKRQICIDKHKYRQTSLCCSLLSIKPSVCKVYSQGYINMMWWIKRTLQKE